MALIRLVQIDAIPTGGKGQVKLDTPDTGIVEIEVVGTDLVRQICLSVAIVREDPVWCLAIRITSEHFEAFGPSLNRLRRVISFKVEGLSAIRGARRQSSVHLPTKEVIKSII